MIVWLSGNQCCCCLRWKLCREQYRRLDNEDTEVGKKKGEMIGFVWYEIIVRRLLRLSCCSQFERSHWFELAGSLLEVWLSMLLPSSIVLCWFGLASCSVAAANLAYLSWLASALSSASRCRCLSSWNYCFSYWARRMWSRTSWLLPSSSARAMEAIILAWSGLGFTWLCCWMLFFDKYFIVASLDTTRSESPGMVVKGVSVAPMGDSLLPGWSNGIRCCALMGTALSSMIVWMPDFVANSNMCTFASSGWMSALYSMVWIAVLVSSRRRMSWMVACGSSISLASVAVGSGNTASSLSATLLSQARRYPVGVGGTGMMMYAAMRT